MTTTSVKSVGNVMNLGPMAVGTAAKSADDSFQTVWNSRNGQGSSAAGKAEDTQKTGAVEKTQDKTSQTAQPKDSGERSGMKTQNARQAGSNETVTEQPEKPGTPEQVQQPDTGLTEEELERAMEVIATAATELIQQIADTFQITVPEAEELMTEMNLQPADILQPENLGSLLLEAGGAEDSLALLTDEQLYGNFQTLMESGKEIAEQCAADLQMTPEEFGQRLEAVIADTADVVEKDEVQAGEREPEIRIEVEKGVQGQPDGTEQPAGSIQEPTAAGTKETAGGQAQGKKHDRGDASREQNAGNPFLQDIRGEQFRPETQSVQETESPWNADTQNIMRQIMDYMRIQVRPNISSLEMQLHPASLGTLQVQVASKGGVLTANFVTQNEAVKAALESQMVQLKESFEQQGVKVEAIEVTVQTHQFEENLEQGRGRQSESPDERKGRSRRQGLRISGEESGAGAAEEVPQPVSADGSTVDFTA